MGDGRRRGGAAAHLPPLPGAADAQTARQPDPLRWVRTGTSPVAVLSAAALPLSSPLARRPQPWWFCSWLCGRATFPWQRPEQRWSPAGRLTNRRCRAASYCCDSHRLADRSEHRLSGECQLLRSETARCELAPISGQRQ